MVSLLRPRLFPAPRYYAHLCTCPRPPRKLHRPRKPASSGAPSGAKDHPKNERRPGSPNSKKLTPLQSQLQCESIPGSMRKYCSAPFWNSTVSTPSIALLREPFGRTITPPEWSTTVSRAGGNGSRLPGSSVKWGVTLRLRMSQPSNALQNPPAPEPIKLWCPICARSVDDPLVCGDCSAVICRLCGTPLESPDELAFG
jgi:hypothetical protein